MQVYDPLIHAFYAILTRFIFSVCMLVQNVLGEQHPAPAVLGHGIRADPKFFVWGRRGRGEMEDGPRNTPA